MTMLYSRHLGSFTT